MNDSRRSLAFAIDKYPERVEAVPVDQLMMESARQNPKRPAYVKLAMDDDAVKALRGPESRRSDLWLLVRVPKEVLERSESRIVLPHEVG